MRRRSFSGSFRRFRRALFEKISFQVTLDLLEGHELPLGDLRAPSLDRLHLLRGGFVPGKVLNAQVSPQRVLDERGARTRPFSRHLIGSPHDVLRQSDRDALRCLHDLQSLVRGAMYGFLVLSASTAVRLALWPNPCCDRLELRDRH